MKMKTSIVLAFALMIANVIPVSAAGIYEHDPMANPVAAKDIVIDPGAIYGYAPSPNSSRLKEYVEYDWSDPVIVGKMRNQREEYHDSTCLYPVLRVRILTEIFPWLSFRRGSLRASA